MDMGTVLSAAQTLLAALQRSELKQAFSIFSYRSQLNELQDTVQTINAVLCDAETKHEMSQQEQIWIEKLRDAVFEADDLFDEFLTLAELEKFQEAHGSLSNEVSNFFSLSTNPLSLAYRMSHGVKDTRKKLKAIVDNSQFCFKIDPRQSSFKIDHEPIRRRSRETCSYVNEAEIIGREHDLESIVGKLLASDDQSDVSVLSIVGMGGLGKTALAQLVYNDPMVTNAFPLKMWTCVSDEGHQELNLKDIIGKILGRRHLESFTLEEVKSQLLAHLARNKYLLVLDDVWTENRDHWCKLVEYLVAGKRGSYIIVTTRSQNTATITGGQIHELSGLSEENSWLLFEKTAFASHQSNPPDDELVEIGRKIVDRCARVPLAIRVAGSLLYGQEKNKWINVQKIGLANIRNANNGIVPILELSFHHLESPIKNCFRYCTLFPKDYELKKKVLISLWMAQGYIVELDKGQSIEDAAEEYFSILSKRCFFQDIKRNEHGEIKSCRIHDLMHDIAQNVSGKKNYALNVIGVNNVKENIRYLSISNESQFEKYYSLGNLSSFKRLRALDLRNKYIKSLSDSIGELLHLRYIDLSWNKEMEALPKSITKLCNLQTLILRGCKRLKEFPKDLTRLIKLRVLDVKVCFELRLLTPRCKGEMTCLHTFKGVYRVGGGMKRYTSWKQWLDGLQLLKSFISLKGQLEIRIRWPEKNANNDVKEGKLREGLYLKSLGHLNNLQLYFEGGEDGSHEEDEGMRGRVMEDLQPHSNLKRLVVSGYSGVKMPCWLTLLPHLVKLRLVNCHELKYLPCLGNLCHLKYLHLDNMPKLEYILIEEDSRVVLTSTSFEEVSFYASLEKLELSYLPKLKGWRRWIDLEGSRNNSTINRQIVQWSLPQLKEFTIYKCAEFTSTFFCPMLEILVLIHFNEGMQIECTKTNEEASIENPAGSTNHVPNLRDLTVTNGAWLDSVPMESFHSLQTLYIIDDEMVELPSCIQYFSALQTLKISSCSESVTKRCQKDPPGEDWPHIQHIPNIYVGIQRIGLSFCESICNKVPQKCLDCLQSYVFECRPFSVSLLIADHDENRPILYYTDPSGTFWQCSAKAIDSGFEGAQIVIRRGNHLVASALK